MKTLKLKGELLKTPEVPGVAELRCSIVPIARRAMDNEVYKKIEWYKTFIPDICVRA